MWRFRHMFFFNKGQGQRSKKQIAMNALRYYAHRLLPFLLAHFLYEAIEILTLNPLVFRDFIAHPSAFAHLLNETTISFIFSILPYLLYLLALPAGFHGGRHDRAATFFLFALFCMVNATEEFVEVISGSQFHVLTVALLKEPRESLNALTALPGFWTGSMIAALVVLISLALFAKRKSLPPPAPSMLQRLVVLLALCSIAFLLLSLEDDLPGNTELDEICSDGLFSLFGGLFEFSTLPNLVQIYRTPCLLLSLLGLALFAIHLLFASTLGRTASPLWKIGIFGKNLCRRYGAFRVQLLCLLFAVLALRLASLDLYPLMDTTEARYAEMARKMVETGNWLQPQFDYGVPFWGKPPLAFQASALSMLAWGTNAFAARLAPFLAMLGTGLLFYCFPSAGKNKATAAFIILMTSAIGFVAAGAVMTDAFLALGVMLSMVSFKRATERPHTPAIWGYLFFVGLAIGMLSKGPVTLPLCGIPLFLYILIFRKWQETWQRIPWVKGTLLLIILTAPWYLAAEKATPGFLRYFIVGEHFERFVVKGWQGDLYGSGHAHPLGTIWLYAVEMFLPWSLLVPFLFRKGNPLSPPSREEKETNAYLWLWGLSPLLLFTLARNILPAYVLPGIPAFCLLLSRALWKRKRHEIRQLIFLPAPLLLLMLLFAMGGGFRHIEYRCDRDMLQAWDVSCPLFYANDKVTYSGQFYTKGKARALRIPPDELPQDAFLAVREESPLAATLLSSPAWKHVSRGHRWLLFQKTAPRLSSPELSGSPPS